MMELEVRTAARSIAGKRVPPCSIERACRRECGTASYLRRPSTTIPISADCSFNIKGERLVMVDFDFGSEDQSFSVRSFYT